MRRFPACRRMGSTAFPPYLHVFLSCLTVGLLNWNQPSLRAQDIPPPVAQPESATIQSGTNVPPVAQPALPSVGSNSDTKSSSVAGGLVVTTPAAARFDGAMVFFNSGQYADAVKAFSDFVGAFPQDRRREEALYRLAESYRNLDRGSDALAAYTYQTQVYPEGPFRTNGELRRGALLFDAGKLNEAVPSLRYVASHGNGELQQAARYLLGKALLALQKEPEGRALLRELIDQQPAAQLAGSAAQTLAELDDAQNKPAEALLLWENAVVFLKDPAMQATAAARGGWSALAANQPGPAEKMFQTARQLNAPDESRRVANTGLLRLLFSQRRFAEWLGLYGIEKDKLLDSARSEILYALGHAQFSTKHWTEAVAAFDQYLRDFGTQDGAVTAAYERFLALTQDDRAGTAENAEAYLKAWPQSPYRARVRLLEAQELSREKKFDAALPLWESLAAEPASAQLPHRDILLEVARAYDELQNWPKAATAYRAFLDETGKMPPRTLLAVQTRLALCLQNSDQLLAATDAWKAVQAQAPTGSPEQQIALESLGLIYSRGGPAQQPAQVETFRTLLDKFPQSKLRALAAFSVGDSLFRSLDYSGAESYLLNARTWDAPAWNQPATQRLTLGAYGLKNYGKTVGYLQQYDALPLSTDPQAKAAARLPAALFYWLGETARQTNHVEEAEIFYTRVTQHPDPGDLLPGAWWQLGEVQSRRREWPAAVASYQRYQQLKPEVQGATVILLALGRAELGAQNFEAAKTTGQQALLQEPEGPRSASTRMLLGETAFAMANYPEAARMFATLAVLFEDPAIAPQAMARAADSFERAGNSKAAGEWRQKLNLKFPGYLESSYL